MKKVLSPISLSKMSENAAKKPLFPRGPLIKVSCICMAHGKRFSGDSAALVGTEWAGTYVHAAAHAIALNTPCLSHAACAP